MLDIQSFLSTFPEEVVQGNRYNRFICGEFLQTMILDYLFYTPYYSKVVLIGGANLRIVQRIDRFTEDIDFDCKDMTEKEFVMMTDDIMDRLRNNGVTVNIVNKEKPKLTAFQRVLSFPLIFNEFNIVSSNHRPILLKIQAQDQKVNYVIEREYVERDRFTFCVQVPPLDVLCAMKFSSILSHLRINASDYYDIPFLLSKTNPNLDFLKERSGIFSIDALKTTVLEKINGVNLDDKKKWLERLLINDSSANNIMQIKQCIASM